MKKANLLRFSILMLLAIFASSIAMNAQAWVQGVQKSEKKNFFTIQKSFNDYWKNKTITKGSGWKPFKRWENFWESRVDSNGDFPDAMKIYQDWNIWQQNNKNTPSTSAESIWKPLGPMDRPKANNSPTGMGRINCIAFDPNNLNSIWAGAAYGGVWHSSNNGQTWETFPFTEFLSIGISDIAIAYPQTPASGTFIYAATGDADGSLSGSTCYSIGIIKSSDNGKNWKITNFQKSIDQRMIVNKILVDPKNHNVVYAAASTQLQGDTTGGLYQSTDGGDTWAKLSGFAFRDMKFKPDNADIIYGSVVGYIGGQPYVICVKYKVSTQELTATPLRFEYPTVTRLALAVNKNYPDNVYGVYVANDGGLHSVVKTTDAGNTWVYMARRETHKDLLNADWNLDQNTTNSQGWYDLAIASVPNNPDEVYIGGVNIVKLLNNGLQWSLKAHWTTQYEKIGVQYVHADQHFLAYSPSGVLFSCNDGGISKTADDGKTWTDISKGLQVTQFYNISSAKNDETMVIGGSQDNGTHVMRNGNWSNIRGGDGMYCIIDSYNSDLLYTSIYYGDFMRSKNAGASLEPMIDTNYTHEKAGWIAPLVIDPSNPLVLYAGYLNIWKGDNYGQQGQWTKISTFKDTYPIVSIAVAPSDRNVIYLSKMTGVWMTTTAGGNDGTAWEQIVKGGPVTDIIIDPKDPLHFWTTLGGYNKDQKVVEWKNKSFVKYLNENLPNVPVNCMVYQQNNPDQRMYIGTDVGVFYRDKNMTKWELFGTGLPNVVVNDLDIQYSSGMLRAGTFGRGLWEVKISNCALPPPQIKMIGKTTLCPNDSIILESVATFPVYRWSTGDTTKSIVIKKGGTYTLNITDDKGCQAISDPISITLMSVPEISITVTGTTTICEGDTVKLSATPALRFQTFLWSDGQTTKEINVTQSGKYTVIGTTSAGCKSYSKEVDIIVNPAPVKPTVTRAGNTLTSTQADRYQWYYNGSQILAGGRNQEYVATKSGKYFVKTFNTANCTNSSDVMDVDITDVDDATGYFLSLHPNPTKNNVVLETYLENESSIIISINDLIGTELFKYTSSATGNFKKELDVAQLPVGVYFVNIKINNKLIVKKLVKQ
jgi:hypothetical protein